MRLPDMSNPLWFLLAAMVVFAVVIGRYFLIAGIFYGVFHLWFPEKWNQRKINNRAYKKDQFRKEMLWSTTTALIFGLSGAFTLLFWQKDYTKVYFELNEYPVWWLPASLVAALALHETYYYWLHRWMHHPKVFKIVHKVHHDSNVTSPWTAFSFHPIEGVFLAIVLAALLMILPVH
jgi:sterol desaturase/sphingolipid hydroxylase (fatty acid hydroxylase superfamily)